MGSQQRIGVFPQTVSSAPSSGCSRSAPISKSVSTACQLPQHAALERGVCGCGQLSMLPSLFSKDRIIATWPRVQAA